MCDCRLGGRPRPGCRVRSGRRCYSLAPIQVVRRLTPTLLFESLPGAGVKGCQLSLYQDERNAQKNSLAVFRRS
ncbi:hypothetical protein EMIT0196P_20084 [Pseudomonas chlororaphis]